MNYRNLIYMFCLFLASCATKNTKRDCISASLNNLHEVLVSKVGNQVCITGELVLQPHFTYIKTIYTQNGGLYGGKIYLPYRYADAIRVGMKNGQQFEFRGVLDIRVTSENCKRGECSLYYLNRNHKKRK